MLVALACAAVAAAMAAFALGCRNAGGGGWGSGSPLACAGVYPPVEVATDPHVDPTALWGRGGRALFEVVLDAAQRLSAAGAAAAGRTAARSISLAERVWSLAWHCSTWGSGG